MNSFALILTQLNLQLSSVSCLFDVCKRGTVVRPDIGLTESTRAGLSLANGLFLSRDFLSTSFSFPRDSGRRVPLPIGLFFHSSDWIWRVVVSSALLRQFWTSPGRVQFTYRRRQIPFPLKKKKIETCVCVCV